MNTSTRQAWKWWLIAVVIALIVQCLTLDSILLFYKDQAQIIDYGRLTFDPRSNWSVSWRLAEGKPILLWSYLGPLIADISYQLSGLSSIGSRVAALIGGLIAATIAFGWLLERKVSMYAAFSLSLALMLDPLFVLSQRIGRMDSWVIAFGLASCWVLHRASHKENVNLNKWRFIAAGCLAGVSTLIWPSAIFLYPLILYELIHLRKINRKVANKWRTLGVNVFYFCVGGALTILLLLLPIWESLVVLFGDLTSIVSQNVDSSKSLQSRVFALFDYNLWFKIIKAFIKTFTPLFPLIAFGAILIRRDWALVVATLITVALIFGSLIYEHRALYLLPYFLILSSSAFTYSAKNQLKLLYLKLANIALALLVIWAIGISLVVRTSMGLMDTKKEGRKTIHTKIASFIGSGEYRVFLGFTYELYFIGRALGWQLYTPYVQYKYDSAGNWISNNNYGPEEKFNELLSHIDYAIFPLGSVNDSIAQQLFESGLHYRYVLGNDDYTVEEVNRLSWTNKDVFTWYLKGDIIQEQYVLYARERKISKTLSRSNNYVN